MSIIKSIKNRWKYGARGLELRKSLDIIRHETHAHLRGYGSCSSSGALLRIEEESNQHFCQGGSEEARNIAESIAVNKIDKDEQIAQEFFDWCEKYWSLKTTWEKGIEAKRDEGNEGCSYSRFADNAKKKLSEMIASSD